MKKEKLANIWEKIKQDYVFNDLSIRELHDKYKKYVGRSAIAYHSKNEHWVEEKEKKQNEIETISAQKNTETEIQRRIEANEKHNQILERSAGIIQNLLEEYETALQTTDKKKLNTMAIGFKAVMECIEKYQKCQRQALNIDNSIIEEETEPEIFVIEGLDESKL